LLILRVCDVDHRDATVTKQHSSGDAYCLLEDAGFTFYVIQVARTTAATSPDGRPDDTIQSIRICHFARIRKQVLVMFYKTSMYLHPTPPVMQTRFMLAKRFTLLDLSRAILTVRESFQSNRKKIRPQCLEQTASAAKCLWLARSDIEDTYVLLLCKLHTAQR
jgi:hypothetical protein